MEQDNYRVLTDINEITQYIDNIGGFSGFALGNLQFDSAGLALSIEEVIDGEDWPRESSGRIWYLVFSRISNVSITVDMSLGFWINNITIGEGGNISIESEQGTVSLVADAIELSIPADALPAEPEAELPPFPLMPNGEDLVSDDAPSEPDPVPQPVIDPVVNATPAPQPQPVANQTPAPEADEHTETIEMMPSTTSPQENPFLNDPNFIPLTPVTPTARPKAPDEPLPNAIFSK